MYVAKDASGNYVAVEHANRETEYFCPACDEPLIQRRGDHNAHHFAHRSVSDCCMSEPMTEWHLGWQREFPDDCREVVFKMGDEKRRADIACKDLVVEFQHSAISSDEIYERTEFYKNIGKHVCWVFDCENYSLDSILEWRRNSWGKKHFTGNFKLPKRTWYEGFITDYSDIVVLDFHNICVVLSGWCDECYEDVENSAEVCLPVSRKFVVSMFNSFDKLEEYGWDLYEYLQYNGDRIARGVCYAVTRAFPNIEEWKIRNTLKYVDMYVLGMDTNDRSTYPYLFFVPEKKRKDDFKWWYPYLTMAEARPEEEDLRGLYKALHSNTLAHIWGGIDGTLDIIEIDLSRAVFYVLMSVTEAWKDNW